MTKREHTRQQILDTALRLFRDNGFDGTSMREIAAAAGLSLGAAYYHFDSKEALVAAWYADIQARHEELVARGLALEEAGDLAARVGLVLKSKLGLIRQDRRFLSALFRYAAEPDHPLSVFSPATAQVREAAKKTLRAAICGQVSDPAVEDAIVDALWLGHLGLLLVALHDRGDGLIRATRLADLMADTTQTVARFGDTPMGAAMIRGIRERVQAAMAEQSADGPGQGQP